MDLKYRMKGQEKDKGEEVRVLFDPPLAGYEEVKPRLLAMTADAQEALGMVRPSYFFSKYYLHLTSLLNVLNPRCWS